MNKRNGETEGRQDRGERENIEIILSSLPLPPFLSDPYGLPFLLLIHSFLTSGMFDSELV
jgi:hypothetical protein